MPRFLSLIVLLIAFPLAAQDLTNFEKVLIPLKTGSSGWSGVGSHWSMQLSAYWPGSDSVRYFPEYLRGGNPPPAPVIGSFPSNNHAGPTLVRRIGSTFDDPTPSPARLLYLERRGLPVALHLRVHTSTETAQVEVPVVREREFHTGTIVLPDVPIRDNERILVRVYAPDREPEVEFTIRYRSVADSDRVVEQRVIARKPPMPFGSYTDDGTWATYAEAFPPAGIFFEPHNIEVSPASSSTRFWAMATVTHNESQQVLTVTPQSQPRAPLASEKVLIPLYAPPGGPWQTHFAAYDRERRVTTHPPLALAHLSPARMMYLAPDASPQLHFHLRAFAMAAERSPGVEIPVVREADFRTGTLILPNVTINRGGRRVLVRLYAPDREPEVEFTVRFRSHSIAYPTLERQVIARRITDDPSFATYAELAMTPENPPGSPAFGAQYAVEISPSNPQTRFWAFLTTTRDDTLEVLTHTPQ